jgi:hypothetical protein
MKQSLSSSSARLAIYARSIISGDFWTLTNLSEVFLVSYIGLEMWILYRRPDRLHTPGYETTSADAVPQRAVR